MENELYNVVSNNIQMLLKKNQKSQVELCQGTGISQSTINCIIQCKRNMSIATATKIADYFDISIDELVGRNVEKKIDCNVGEYIKAKETLEKIKGLLW